MKRQEQLPVEIKETEGKVTITITGNAFENLKRLTKVANLDAKLDRDTTLGKIVSTTDMSEYLAADIVALVSPEGAAEVLDKMIERREQKRNRLLAELAFVSMD